LNDLSFLVTYVESCTGGKLGFGDCGPVWQLGVIAALLIIMITALLVMRVRARLQPEQA
jgi:hypothetical protein